MLDDIKNTTDYNLVWEADFSDTSKIREDFNIEVDSSLVFNNELQTYVDSDSNVYCKGNRLYVRALRTLTEDGEFEYTSAFLTTTNKREFTYGRFETRMKLPYGSGFMPFFKLCPNVKDYSDWPVGGQIDVMSIPTRTPGKNYSSIHYGINATLEQGAYTFKENFNASDDFHTYVCEWNPGKLEFFVDGEKFFESNVDEPFNHDFHIELGMAVGGNLAGPPAVSTSFAEKNSFIIDYFRVYQKPEYAPLVKKPIRGTVAVCGSWEDAENFNIFIRALQTPEFTKRYVTAAFTFGALEHEDERIDEQKLVSYVESCNPSALVVFAQMIHNEQIVEALVDIATRKDIPVFMFEKFHENTINVICDYDLGFEDVCKHIVVHHGISDVDMFAGFEGNEFSDRRIAVYKKVLEDNGIPFDKTKVHYGDFWDEAAASTLAKLIDSGYKVPRAIVCANDSMALGVESTLHKYGYKVPDDVSVIGFDGIRETALHNPAISSCTLDYSGFVDELINALDNWHNLEVRTDLLKWGIGVGYKTLYRRSCGCERPETAAEMADLISTAAHDNNDNFRHMYEMSRFVSQAVKLDDFFKALSVLEHYLWLWTDQYYFVGLQGEDEKLRVLFSGYRNVYKHDHRYTRINKALPDIEMLLEEDSDINVILFKQIRVHSDDFVFAVTGLKTLPLRSEQRFEEFVLFMSTVLNSVYNNQNFVRVNKEIEKISEVDYLTELYNRRGFFKEIERRIKASKYDRTVLSLFSVDMDGLKTVNDTYGHNAGDLAITILAEALVSYVGGIGICARYGGDEFAFAILSDDASPINIEQVHASLQEIIRNNPKSLDLPFTVSASVGFAQKIIDDAFDIDEMIKEADDMMYADKKERKKKAAANQ